MTTDPGATSPSGVTVSMATISNCPNCGSALAADAQSCPQCAYPIASLPVPPPFPVVDSQLGNRTWQAPQPAPGAPGPRRRKGLVVALVIAAILALLLIAAGLISVLGREAQQRSSGGRSPTPTASTPRSPSASPSPGSGSPSATPSRSPGGSPTRSPDPSGSPRPGGGGGGTTRSPDSVAALAAQALNAGDAPGFSSLAIDDDSGRTVYTLMTRVFGRPGWESGECEAVGPLYACKMFHSGEAAGALVLDGNDVAKPIVAWTGPGG